MAMTEPLLFLDFDGVLHPLGEPALDEDFHLLDNPGLFVWLPILEQILAPYPSVRIVVSSDWRRLFDDASLVRLLGPLGKRFAGVVEVHAPSRATEILDEALRRKTENWLALDDHPSVALAGSSDGRFVACPPSRGIASLAVQRALRRKLAVLA
ncbi:HAD domain-containing protein [Paraburkholderia sp. BR14320]|uniref:HAD domain-containing protein n=1 Tax=unclassified Paraburkholderia TaxID=2615204 RepID=UPI0034CD4BB5